VVRSLLSLYIRAGVGVANLTLRVAARGVDLATDMVRNAMPASAEPARSESEDVFGEPVAARQEAQAEPQQLVEHERPAVEYDSATPEPLDETSERVKTVDDEPELVAEFAEPGAEEGASATVEVDEPWDGYDELTADEAIARIGGADAAELAVVELYERAHKRRRTVLTAAERRQRELANAPS
jgi:hypothetical protein